MPQKRNPDALELIRGKAGRFSGHLSAFLTCVTALPSTYNKDIQEDKFYLFNAIDEIKILIPLLTNLVSTLKADEDNCKAHVTAELFATDLAYYLVKEHHVPFRKAHELVGELVLTAEKMEKTLDQMTRYEIHQALKFSDSGYEGEVIRIFTDPARSVEQYDCIGGCAPESVKRQILYIQEFLKLQKFKIRG